LTILLPIRIRLALWFFSIFAVATLTLALVSVWMVHSTILTIENHELYERVRSVEKFLSSRPAGEPFASLQSAMSVYDISHGGKWLQVIDQDGRWIHRSPHIADLFPALDTPQEVGNSERFFKFAAGPVQVRALIAAIHVHGRSYTVQTGVTMDRKLRALEDYRLHLVLLVPVILLGAGVVGYFASSKALSPVAAITGEARRISSQNLGVRLPVLKTRDELDDMAETLNQMLDRIDTGYRTVKEFTANAAHELRTPLSLLRAEAEIALAFERSAAENRCTLEHIETETIRMSRLVDDLLLLARSDAGVQLLRFEPLDLNEAARSAAARWIPQLRHSAVDLSLVASEQSAIISADRSSIERLLDILLENAWKYSPEGGRIELSTSVEARSIVLSVSDSGIGIPAEQQEKIFDRFFRVNPGNDGSAEAQGSGLGLALARQIVDAHRAKIAVRSELCSGSSFSVRFERLTGEPASPSVNSQLLAKDAARVVSRPEA